MIFLKLDFTYNLYWVALVNENVNSFDSSSYSLTESQWVE